MMAGVAGAWSRSLSGNDHGRARGTAHCRYGKLAPGLPPTAGVMAKLLITAAIQELKFLFSSPGSGKFSNFMWRFLLKGAQWFKSE